MAHMTSLDALTTQLEVCEISRRSSTYVTTLKADITGLRRDVYELKSIDISMRWGNIDILQDPSTTMLAIHEIPLATMTEMLLQLMMMEISTHIR